MISSFRNFLVEEEKTVYFTFGRMNPPTIGHGKLIDTLAKKAGNNPYRIFVSQSTDPKKNPLDYTSKVKFIRKMFPKHARSIMLNRKVKNVMDIATALYNEGYKSATMVVGSDRVQEFQTLLQKYNGVDGRHGHYNFKKINVISAGDRDPDAEGVEGMSASKMRSFASNNDFASFSQGLPKRVSNADAKALFNNVRKGMGLKEEKNFKRHIELEPVSETRENYVRGNLFEEGTQVVIKDTDQIGTVIMCGSNYLVIEAGGARLRKWLDDVEILEVKHRLDPKLSFKHQVKHGTQYVDVDGDGDVDAADRMKKAKEFGDVGGVPDLTKALKKRQDMEKKHTKKGVAYESKDDVKEEDPCWPGYRQVGTKEKNGKVVPNCVKEKIEVSQDKDIDELPGSQPASFQKGIKSKSTKAARHRHFQRMTKKDDDDKSAYKDAPGDKGAREKGTKPSQYTKKYKQMYGEQMKDPIDVAKQRIDREKKIDAKKHDNMLDRARIRAAKQKIGKRNDRI